jgi:hypothetical protein
MKNQTLPIDFDKINLPEFFGCVNATNTKQMKSNAFKTLRTWLQEKSFAKWSDEQVEYVGDFMDGADFIDQNGICYEMKGKLKMFNKNGSTSVVDLKNFRGETKVVEKTFEYMLLVDTSSMTIGFTDWETVKQRLYFSPTSPVAKFKLFPGDYKILSENVIPTTKSITSSEILDNLLCIL